jgi:hypothetical protein
LDCHNLEQLYPNIQESKQYALRGGDCVEVCSNETEGADISYKSVSKLCAALVAIVTLCAYKCSEEMTGNLNSEVQKGSKAEKSLFQEKVLLLL